MQNSTLLAWLVGYEGTTGEIRFELSDSETTLGRGSDCDIQLDDPLTSRKHAIIHFRSDGFEIEDLDSSNGTFVNNEQITSVPLHENDLIKIGETILKFRMEPDPDATIMQTRSSQVTMAAMRQTIPHEHGAVHCRGCGQPNPKGGKFCSKCGVALPQLPESFQKTLELFIDTQASFTAREITKEQYHAALADLLVQDDKGEYWMLGVETGEWYWYDGDDWHLRLPPLLLSEEERTPQPDIPVPQEPDQSEGPLPSKTKSGRWGVIALWIFSALIVLALGVYTGIELVSYSQGRTENQLAAPGIVEESPDSIDTTSGESDNSSAAATPTLYAQDTRNEIQVRPYDPAIDSSLISVSEQTEFLPDQSSEGYTIYEGYIPGGTPGLLTMGWCAIDLTTLESNMASIRMEGTFDSVTIPPAMWTEENLQEEGMYCRYYKAVVEGLEQGTHKFIWSTSYDVPIFDGWDTYPPETYINVDILNVEELYIFNDDFNSNVGHWGEGELDEGNIWIEGGDLHIELYQSSIGVMSKFLEREFSDFIVITHARSLSETPGSYGIVFRYQDDQTYYFFEVSDEGSFRLGKQIGDNIDLIPWTQSDAILKDGGVNRLTVSMEGDWILALINGELVADIQDSSIKDGKLYLSATTPQEADYYHTTFQKVSIEAPE